MQGRSRKNLLTVGGDGAVLCKMAVQEDPEFTSFHRHTEPNRYTQNSFL